MSEVVYTSRAKIERIAGPLRRAHLSAVAHPVYFGVHGAIARHYGVDPAPIEEHATTVDYVVAATGG